MEWHKVTKELPIKPCPLLVFVEGRVSFAKYAPEPYGYNKPLFWGTWGDSGDMKVTHWCFLPEAPND